MRAWWVVAVGLACSKPVPPRGGPTPMPTRPLAVADAAPPSPEAQAVARYERASQLAASGQRTQALELLAALDDESDCEPCNELVDSARGDDRWQSLWGEPEFWKLHETPPASASDVECPDGSELVENGSERYCTRGDVRHGPFAVEEYVPAPMHDHRRTFGAYREGKEHGRWSHFDTTTGEAFDGYYREGVKHGMWIETEGVRGPTTRTTYGAYVNDDRVGLERVLGSEREEVIEPRVVEEGRYVDGAADGTHRSWNLEPYYVSAEAHYQRGTRVGTWLEYDAPELVSKRTPHVDGKVHGIVEHFREGVRVRVEHFDRGELHGDVEYWHQCKLVGKTTLQHGSGRWIEYRGTELVARGSLVGGVREGAWTFEQHGRWFEGSYRAGKRTGAWTEYSARNRRQKVTAGTFADDQRHGTWTFWANGKREGTGTYVKGVADGAWQVFGARGKVQRLVIRERALASVDGRPATPGQQRYFTEVAASFVTYPQWIQELSENAP